MTIEAEIIPAEEIRPQDFLVQGEFKFFTVTDTGLIVRPTMDEPTWLSAVQASILAYKSTRDSHIKMMFRVGDLLRFGESKFGERWAAAISDTFAQMITESVMSRAMWVAGSIPSDVRREDLSFEHHEAVAKLEPDEQREFLEKAAEEKWNTKELKEAVKERHPSKPRAVKTGKNKKSYEPEKVTKKAALAAADTIIAYFKAAEEEHGSASKWDDAKREDWIKPMLELNKITRRVAIPSHGKK